MNLGIVTFEIASNRSQHFGLSLEIQLYRRKSANSVWGFTVPISHFWCTTQFPVRKI